MLLFISIFDLRFLQEEYARRVWMKYFWNMPGRVWSVCEANSLKILSCPDELSSTCKKRFRGGDNACSQEMARKWGAKEIFLRD